MSERLSITPLGPYIGAQITGADLTRPLSDNQFEQLYHAVLRHQVVFLRDQAITPQQQRALAQRFGELHIHPVYPHADCLLYTNPHPGICDVCQSALGGLFPSGSFLPPRQRFFELFP
ncbi:TauD/TfdA family dioxygenase, partial [Escherichia coli]